MTTPKKVPAKEVQLPSPVAACHTPAETEPLELAPVAAGAGDPTFASQYFRSQLAEFHRLMGTREFWQKGQLDLAVKAIGLLFLRLESPTESDRNLLNACLIGATMRAALLESNPPHWMQEIAKS